MAMNTPGYKILFLYNYFKAVFSGFNSNKENKNENRSKN